MLRMTKQADYGIVLLTHMGLRATQLHNARDLAQQTMIPAPMVSKILKVLARGGILTSQRGTKGGYTLSRLPDQIHVAEILLALEGPVAITECVGTLPSNCSVERICPVRPSWMRINQAIKNALDGITLHELIYPAAQPHPAGQALPQLPAEHFATPTPEPATAGTIAI